MGRKHSCKRKIADARLEFEDSLAPWDTTSNRLLGENARLRQRLADLEHGLALARALFVQSPPFVCPP
jgi:hypothetical protein